MPVQQREQNLRIHCRTAPSQTTPAEQGTTSISMTSQTVRIRTCIFIVATSKLCAERRPRAAEAQYQGQITCIMLIMTRLIVSQHDHGGYLCMGITSLIFNQTDY